MESFNLDRCVVTRVPTITDPRGNLGFLNELEHVPFSIARAYFLWGVPKAASRGGHAHRTLQQFLIAVNGSLDIVLRDGVAERRVRLETPTEGLLIGPFIWRELENFSSDTSLLVLASAPYDESDYMRDFDEFLRATQAL